MNDTTPEISIIYRQMLMARSGEERIWMCASMFDSARELVIASLPKDLTPREFKKQLYERTYGESLPDDFPFDES